MPVSVKGGLELRKALRKFAPDLAKETQKEMAGLLKPITQKARGFVPSNAPLSGWGRPSENGFFPQWNAPAAKAGIGYRTSPSKPNKQGWRSLASIVNASAAGAIYETAGRKNPQGQPQAPMQEVMSPTHANYGKRVRSGSKGQSRSNNPNAGKQFIDAINAHGNIVDANNQAGRGRRSGKMKGRLIFRAWAEDGGKTTAAILKAIEASKVKFHAAMGYK